MPFFFFVFPAAMTAECIVGRRTEHTGRGGTIHIIGGTYLRINRRRGRGSCLSSACCRPANAHRLCFRQLQVLFPAKYYCIYFTRSWSKQYVPPSLHRDRSMPSHQVSSSAPNQLHCTWRATQHWQAAQRPPFPPPPPKQGKCLTSTGTWNWNQLRLSPLYYLPDLTSYLTLRHRRGPSRNHQGTTTNHSSSSVICIRILQQTAHRVLRCAVLCFCFTLALFCLACLHNLRIPYVPTYEYLPYAAQHTPRILGPPPRLVSSRLVLAIVTSSTSFPPSPSSRPRFFVCLSYPPLSPETPPSSTWMVA